MKGDITAGLQLFCSLKLYFFTVFITSEMRIHTQFLGYVINVSKLSVVS
jgi:hypothetical protein